MKYITGTLKFIWDFIVGDTPEIAAGAIVIVAVSMFISGATWAAAVLLPLAVLGLLYLSVRIGKARG